MPATYSREAVVDGLPSAQDLIDAARAAMAGVSPVPRDPAKAAEKRLRAAGKVLDRWAPAIDELADQDRAARFLGYASGDTVRRKRYRTDAEGRPEWPEPAPGRTFGRSPTWTYREIALWLAGAPGRGHPGFTGGRDWDRSTLRGAERL